MLSLKLFRNMETHWLRCREYDRKVQEVVEASWNLGDEGDVEDESKDS